MIPVIYNLNFRDPAGYFLATRFPMRNKDVIYASNAFAVESGKGMNYFRLVVATANDPVVAAINGFVLRNLAAGVETSTVGATSVSITP